MPTTKELIKHFDAVYHSYRWSVERAESVQTLRRKHSAITETDLLKTFTV